MQKIRLVVGSFGKMNATRPVCFTGQEVAEASGDACCGRGCVVRHDWILYRVTRGFRVFVHCWPRREWGMHHYALSSVLDPCQVSEEYPILADAPFDAPDIREHLE